MANETYKKMYAAITKGTRNQQQDDIIGAVVDGLCGALGDDNVLDALPECGGAALGFGAIYSVYKLITSKKQLAELPNPHFIGNGQCDADDPASPVTLKYMRSRIGKQLAATGIAFGGQLLAKGLLADVDVVGGLQHINATGSSLAHIMKFKSIAKSYKQSETIQKWIDLLVTMKAMKSTTRGGQAICSFIPGAGLPMGIAAAVIKIGMKLTMTRICYWTAADLHWRAFVERRINRNAVGPGGRIIAELFTRRGATRIFGKYDIDSIINEPCGWMAVADKILLI